MPLHSTSGIPPPSRTRTRMVVPPALSVWGRRTSSSAGLLAFADIGSRCGEPLADLGVRLVLGSCGFGGHRLPALSGTVISRRRIFPVALLGSSSTNQMRRGYL